MRKFAFLAPLAAALAVAAAPAMAEPASITVTFGGELQDKLDELGEREVRDQADRLTEIVQRALAHEGALDGAEVNLVLTDLKPNRPTFQQMLDRPGLDGYRSISIGGAAISGQVKTADGAIHPVEYDWYSTSLADVVGGGTWQDADRAYRRLALNLADGRYAVR